MAFQVPSTDVAALLGLDEGAQTATCRSLSFPVRFRATGADALGMSGSTPIATLASSDAASLVTGDVVYVAGRSYRVLRIEGVGTGVSVLVLREVDDAGISPMSSRLLGGRVAMVDCRHSSFLGQDDAGGSLNLSSILTSSAAKDALAAVGFGYFPFDRAFTATGQYAISELLERNPDFEWMVYLQFGHVRASDPGAARQLDSDIRNLLWDYRALDTSQQPVVAFRNAGVITAYWANYCFPNSGGEAFNKDLLDAQIDLVFAATASARYKPVGCKVDYLNSTASGPYPYDGQTLDFDQDGTGYASDAEEQASFAAAQQYFLEQLVERFGSDFAVTANGSPAWPGQDSELAARLHGWYLEGFPSTPWFDPYESFDKLWTARQSPGAYLDHNGRIAASGMPLFHTDLRPAYSLTSDYAKIGRAAALLFDGWWRYRPLDGDSAIVDADILDSTWDSIISACGAPSGPPTRFDAGDASQYSRVFAGGTATLILDSSLPSLTQLVYYSVPGA